MSSWTVRAVLVVVLVLVAGAGPAVGAIDGPLSQDESSSARTVSDSGLAAQPSPGSTVTSANVTTDRRVSVVIVFESHAVREAAAFPDLPVNVTGGQDVAFMPVLYATVPENAIDAIERRAGVDAVYRDSTVSNPDDGTGGDTALAVQSTGQQTPWGVDRIDAPEATQATTDALRANVTVAVLDTGIDYTHPDLDSVSWGANFASGVEQTGRSSAMDNSGHGTGVAGIVAAADNDQGVVGVAPGTDMYAIKVLDSGGRGQFKWVVSGIEAAISGPDGELGSADDADVISMSLGSDNSSDGLEDVVAHASEHAVIVSAAGNEGNGDASVNNVTYPGKYPGSIAVAATDRQDRTPIWSSEGSDVELSAPGVDVTMTALNGGTTSDSGTSFAAPHVSGVAALVIAQDIADGSRDLSDTAVRERLRNATVDIESEGVDPKSGHGLVLADEALDVDSLDNPSFSVRGLSPGDTAIGPNERSDVSATVTNEGGLAGTQRVSMVVDGTVVAERSVTLAGGQSRVVSFADVFRNLSPGEYEYHVSSDDDEATAAVTVLEPAYFAVSELSPTNASVVRGESIAVTATVENVGGVEGTQSVELRANGSVLDEQELTLPPGANATVSLERGSVGLQPGTYDFGVFSANGSQSDELAVLSPSSFVVQSLTPENVTATVGEPFTVSATVENVGDVAGNHSVELRLADSVVGSETVTLDSRENTSVTYEVPTVDRTPGTYSYAVHADDSNRTGTLTLRPDVTRSLSASTVEPGDDVTVSLEANVSSTSASLSESFSPAVDGAAIDAVAVDGEPVEPLISGADDTGLVVRLVGIDANSTVTVRYTLDFDADAEVGSTHEITGEFTDDRTVSLLPDEITVRKPTVDVRELSATSVRPGGEVTVRLETTATQSRLSFSEAFEPGFDRATLESVSVDDEAVTPVFGAAEADGAVVAMSDVPVGSTVLVQYTLGVSDNASIGSTYTITGEVTNGWQADVVGDQVTVQEGSPLDGVAGIYDVDHDGSVTLSELGTAASDYANGELSLSDLGTVAAAYANS